MRVVTVSAMGDGKWALGLVGVQSERFRSVTLTESDLASLSIVGGHHSFDGDAKLLHLGLQAYSLRIAWEFDPYFGLSISRVDPLPHQLSAVYDHLLLPISLRFYRFSTDRASRPSLTAPRWR
jgi:hypothetical protein